MTAVKEVYQLLVESVTLSFKYCLICFAIHFLLSKLSSIFVPKFDSLNSKSKKMWFNRGTSIFHAIILFVMTIYYWVFLNPSMKISNLYDYFEAYCLDIMMGYLWYDIFVELTSTRQFDTLGHHFLGLISHLSSRLSDNDGARFYRLILCLNFINNNYLVC